MTDESGTRFGASIGALTIALMVALAFVSPQSFGDADPAWLKSWNEAQEQRPQSITPRGRIGSQDEPGTPLIVAGLVVRPDGQPAADVLVHAYHRDRDGFDFGPNDKALTTWRLHGWARTDADGCFEFQTIRPAPDHLGREGAHIHFTFVTDDFGRQWGPKLFFADDPLVTERQRRRSQKAGDFGSVRKTRKEGGVLYVDAKFRLKEQADF